MNCNLSDEERKNGARCSCWDCIACIEASKNRMQCPECNSTNIVEYPSSYGDIWWICHNCKHQFIPRTD